MIKDKILYISDSKNELLIRNDVFLNLSEFLKDKFNHGIVKCFDNNNQWVETDYYYNFNEEFLLIVKRTFDSNIKSKWITDKVIDLSVEKCVINNQELYI